MTTRNIMYRENTLTSLPHTTLLDAVTLLCGKELGSGISRTVFECPISDTWVCKVEMNTDGYFQNAWEYKVWWMVRSGVLAKWFAPCQWISANGRFLLQDRTYPTTKQELEKHLPKIPTCFGDTKVANWGWIRGGKKPRLVCHDYGTIQFRPQMPLIKSNWWTE